MGNVQALRRHREIRARQLGRDRLTKRNRSNGSAKTLMYVDLTLCSKNDAQPPFDDSTDEPTGNTPSLDRSELTQLGESQQKDQSSSEPLIVLLVEDNLSVRMPLVRILRTLGLVVREAGGVREALAVFASSFIDVLICDIQLPDGSGLDLIRELRTTWVGPAIALSGFATDFDQAASRAAGFHRHLSKPTTARELEHLIRELTERPSIGDDEDASDSWA